MKSTALCDVHNSLSDMELSVLTELSEIMSDMIATKFD